MVKQNVFAILIFFFLYNFEIDIKKIEIRTSYVLACK